MSSIAQFKPCPFCHGKPVIRPVYDSYSDRAKSRYHLQCIKCQASGPVASTEQLAIAKWNSRVKV